MDIEQITKHLNAIKRTSLFCNSLDDLAEKVGIQSLAHNNNFDKVGEDKRVAIYEAFNEEYQTYAESPSVRLSELMWEYEQTSEFYNQNELAKWKSLSEKETILEIMRCIFNSHELPESNKRLKNFVAELYDPEYDKFKIQGINICILLLIAYKVLPTYKSKKGDIPNIEADYAKVKDLLDTFYSRYAYFEDNLRIDSIEQRLKDGVITLNRLALITMFEDIVYCLDRSITSTHENRRYFDLDGIWIDKISSNIYYEIILSLPAYSMNVYEVCNSVVNVTRYALEIILNEDSSLTLVTTHPRGRARIALQRINSPDQVKLSSIDFSTHELTFNDYETPTEIVLKDIKRHPNYDFNINRLYKVDDEKVDEINELFASKSIIDKYEKYKSEYIAGSRIHAITPGFIYITPDETQSDFLYKIPRDKYIDYDILAIDVDDLAGLVVIAQEGPFIGFEKICLYIDISSDEKLKEAHIEKVPMIYID
jgi:hypothetical protein